MTESEYAELNAIRGEVGQLLLRLRSLYQSTTDVDAIHFLARARRALEDAERAVSTAEDLGAIRTGAES